MCNLTRENAESIEVSTQLIVMECNNDLKRRDSLFICLQKREQASCQTM